MHGLVALDGQRRVLRRAILWNDQRAESQCRDVYAAVGGKEALADLTNNAMLPGYVGGKLLWLRQHEPDVFARIRSILLPKDYLRLRLCGDCSTDVSDASGTGLFDVRARTWSRSLLDVLRLPAAWFPRASSQGRWQGGCNRVWLTSWDWTWVPRSSLEAVTR